MKASAVEQRAWEYVMGKPTEPTPAADPRHRFRPMQKDTIGGRCQECGGIGLDPQHQVPAADPRLAELTEALHRVEHPAIEDCILPPGAQNAGIRPCEHKAARLLALLPARTATTEAEALAAAARLGVTELPQTGEAVLRLGVPYEGTEWTPDAIAAALAATGGDDDR